MRVKAVYLSLLAVLPLMFSCTKELSYENSSRMPGTGTFTAVIDGVAWSATDSGKSATIQAGMINLSGLSKDNQLLNILLDDTVTGTYQLNQSTNSLASYSDSAYSIMFMTDEGTNMSQTGGVVTVTSIDRFYHSLSGTFSLKVYRNADGQQRQIQEGFFVNIPYSNTLPYNGGKDTMRAAIDGGNWIAANITSSIISGQMAIIGNGPGNSQPVTLVLPQNIAPGTYNLDYNSFINYGLYSPANGITLVSSTGQMTILENNLFIRRIRGSFAFLATDPSGTAGIADNLANGYFSVGY